MHRQDRLSVAKSDRAGNLQYGALPYRMGPNGLEILLITSRGTGKWLIPKGWPIADKKSHEVAQTEAFQEAGVKGIISKKPIGTYPYIKKFLAGDERFCLVEIYPLQVTMEAITWKEKHERKRLWVSPGEAAELVMERGLAQIILLNGSPSQNIQRIIF